MVPASGRDELPLKDGGVGTTCRDEAGIVEKKTDIGHVARVPTVSMVLALKQKQRCVAMTCDE